jgi:hypothetical protein
VCWWSYLTFLCLSLSFESASLGIVVSSRGKDLRPKINRRIAYREINNFISLLFSDFYVALFGI